MKIEKIYSHLGGSEIMSTRYSEINDEINDVISNVVPFRTKISKEKTKKGKHLYAPRELNTSVTHRHYEVEFGALGPTELPTTPSQ